MERVFLVRSGDRTGLPVTISRFLPAAPLLRIFHRSCCLKLWRALPECTVLTGGHHSCRRRNPLSVPERRTQPS